MLEREAALDEVGRHGAIAWTRGGRPLRDVNPEAVS